MHIKRKAIPKFWPVPKSGTKYLAVPVHEQRNSVPLIMALRDMLKFVKTKKELKKLLNEKKIEVNKKVRMELNYPIALFDTLSMPSIKKHYRAVLDNKRISLVPIEEKEAGIRIYKLIGKKVLPNKKIQLNFNLGNNILSSDKIKIGDFAVFDNTKNKILEILPLKKETKVVVIGGKHIGKMGKIKELVNEGRNLIAKIEAEDKTEISTHVKNLFIMN